MLGIDIYPVLLFIIVGSAVSLLKYKLEAVNQAEDEELSAKRVKYNPQLFSYLLVQKGSTTISIFEKEMIIGDNNAPIQLTMAANLNCYPCSIAFKKVMRLINHYPGKICMNIRLLNSKSNKIGTVPASTYLIRYWEKHIYGEKDESENTRNLIHDWYASMNPKHFAQLYPDAGILEENMRRQSLWNRHYEWVAKTGINRTPSFFLNSYKFPDHYNISDLKVLLPGLLALANENEQLFRNPHREEPEKELVT